MLKGTERTSPVIPRRSGKKLPKRRLVIAITFVLSLVALLPAGVLRVAHAGSGQWTPLGPAGGAALSMVIDPSNGNTLYAQTFNAGVFKSTDAGATWAPINSGMGSAASTATGLSIDPNHPNTLYCGANGANAPIFKSTDGGTSWAVPFDGSGNLNVTVIDTVVDPANSNIISDCYKFHFISSSLCSCDCKTSI